MFQCVCLISIKFKWYDSEMMLLIVLGILSKARWYLLQVYNGGNSVDLLNFDFVDIFIVSRQKDRELIKFAFYCFYILFSFNQNRNYIQSNLIIRNQTSRQQTL